MIKKYASTFAIGIATLLASPARADDSDPCRPLHHCKGSSLTLSPEIYHVKRKREGGTSQNGESFGIRVNYDYIKRYNIYLGLQAFYGRGVLHGHNGNRDKLRSRLTTRLGEGNLGYTFQMKCFPHLSITPFAGFGNFKETNSFSPPSPLQVKFTTKFNYVSFGFLSSSFVAPAFSVGLNARLKYPLDTKCKITGDSSNQTFKQIVGDKIHWRIELPVTYFGMGLCRGLEAALMPFYERQLYGARENYPFDFFKTTYSIYGIDIQIIYRF